MADHAEESGASRLVLHNSGVFLAGPTFAQREPFERVISGSSGASYSLGN